MKSVLNLFLCAALLVAVFAQSGSVYYDKETQRMRVVFGVRDQSAVAWGYHTEERNKTGWNKLHMTSNGAYEDRLQLYATGFLEGALTQPDMYLTSLNFIRNSFKGKHVPEVIVDFLHESLNWMEEQIASSSSDYWKQVDMALQQMRGLIAGYASVAPPEQLLDFDTLYAVVAAGEMADLVPGLIPSQRCEWYRFPQEVCLEKALQSHCTAFVRIPDDKSDLFIGHNLWTSYSAMLRTWKVITLNLHAGPLTVSFSSKPGDLRSKDDFYMLTSGLAVLETSLPILNSEPYDKLDPHTVPTWARVLVANRMSHSASEWTSLFAQHNSGTHNNEWIVVDVNKFKAGYGFGSNAVYVLDQTVGDVWVKDITDEVNMLGYAVSFNIPRSPGVFSQTGYPQFVKAYGKYGHWFEYDKCPRFKLTERDAPKVQTFDQFKSFLRRNDYKNDPLAEGYPFNQIAARWDVIETPNPLNFQPQGYGAVDAKTANLDSFQHMMPHVIGGPTHEVDYLDVFSWDTAPVTNTSHLGEPIVWDFDWMVVEPQP